MEKRYIIKVTAHGGRSDMKTWFLLKGGFVRFTEDIHGKPLVEDTYKSLAICKRYCKKAYEDFAYLDSLMDLDYTEEFEPVEFVY